MHARSYTVWYAILLILIVTPKLQLQQGSRRDDGSGYGSNDYDGAPYSALESMMGGARMKA